MLVRQIPRSRCLPVIVLLIMLDTLDAWFRADHRQTGSNLLKAPGKIWSRRREEVLLKVRRRGLGETGLIVHNLHPIDAGSLHPFRITDNIAQNRNVLSNLCAGL